MAVCQNLVPLVNIKIAGKWMFIPLKMVLIGIDSIQTCQKTRDVLSLLYLRRNPDVALCAARYGQDSGPLDEVRQVEDVRAAARRIARRVNIRGPNGKPLKLWDIHWRFHVINEVILMKHKEVLIWIRVGVLIPKLGLTKLRVESVALLCLRCLFEHDLEQLGVETTGRGLIGSTGHSHSV